MDEIKDVKEEEAKLPVESSTTEETTEEVPQLEEQEASETQEVETETAESGKGANQRIRELVKEKKDAEAKAKSLEDIMAELTGSVESSTQVPQYIPQYQQGEEVSPERLQADVTTTANAIVELKLKQERAINRINNESRDVIQKYPQLNPDSDQFDSELSESVTEAVEAHVKSQPYTASVNKFVDRMMKPYQRSVTKEVGKVTENIAKQVSETALRPTSVRQQEKAASEKSIAELEQELGVVIS